MMQCTRCGQPLQAGVLFCRACGEPVVGSTPVVASDGLAGETGTADLAANPEALSYTGFAFQEFRAAPAPGQPIMPLPPGMPGAGQPAPGMPWSGMPLPGQPGAGMYAPYPPGAPGYPPYAMPPMMPAPTKPKKLWTSVGCIISYVALAVLLVFAGLAVGLYALGSHLGSSAASQKTAAMKLYSQVTSQTPGLTDSMTNASDDSWNLYTGSTYGCAIQSDGLHVHISNSGQFFYCVDNETDAGDIAFQIQMRVLSGNGGGLVFRTNSLDGRYVFELYQNDSCRVFLSKQGAARPTTLASGVARSANQDEDAANILTLIEKGNHYYFYVNGEYVLSLQDSTFTSGSVGVIADDYQSSAEAVYTDAEIWDL